MGDVDLNINNYNLDDLLNLFNLDHNFTHTDLKSAKKIVIKTHPDRSKLDKKYFLFFSKAYKMLYKVYEFKVQATTKSTEYSVEKDEHKEHILEEIKNKPNFNKWFNDLFEKTNQSNLNDSNGYGDWLKSEDDCCNSSITTLEEMNREIDDKKEKVRSLVAHQDISELNGSIGFSIIDNEGGFQSDLFSNLQYEDLKKAHVESVIPVTLSDYQNKKQFKTVNEMQDYRSRQDTAPLSVDESKQYLNQQDSDNAEMSTGRAFQLAKECEINKEKSKEWWAHVNKITHR